MSKLKSGLLSLIIAIALVIPISSLLVPALESYAESEHAPMLEVFQEIETESGRIDRKDCDIVYALTTENVNCPLPDGAEGLEWDFDIEGENEQKIEFLIGDEEASPGAAGIHFYHEGIYHYKLAESKIDRKANIEYDESEYDIDVQVSTERGHQTIKAVWVKRETGVKPAAIRFHNVLKKSKVIGDPPVNVVKRIEGGTPTQKDKFIFVMTPAQEDFPLPYGAVGEYETYLYGEGEIEIGNIEFEKPGFYEYRVWERANPDLDYSFDKTVFMVSYDVREESDGSLSCKRTITRDDAGNSSEDDCTFTNIYNGNNAEPGSDPDEDGSSADTPKGDKPQGNTPKANDPSGNDPSGNNPSGDNPGADKISGNAPSGDGNSGIISTITKAARKVATGDSTVLGVYVEALVLSALILLAEYLRKKTKKAKIT